MSGASWAGAERAMTRAGQQRDRVAPARRRVRKGVTLAVGAFAAWLLLAASASAFTAQGSAKQVYVTGLPANAEVALVNAQGATVSTQSADSLGGLLFRNVAPGSGYRVRVASTGETSPRITVHSDAAPPWDPSIYNQSIPDNGYTYLTTRDGTQLAITSTRRAAPRASQACRRASTSRPSRSRACRRRATRRRTRR